jgi:hypothetical protein
MTDRTEHRNRMQPPPIIPGPAEPYTLASVMPAPAVKRRVHPASIVLAVLGGLALLCGGFLSIGAMAVGSKAAARGEPVARLRVRHGACAQRRDHHIGSGPGYHPGAGTPGRADHPRGKVDSRYRLPGRDVSDHG